VFEHCDLFDFYFECEFLDLFWVVVVFMYEFEDVWVDYVRVEDFDLVDVLVQWIA